MPGYRYNNRILPDRRGQTLVIAIMVMFILAVVSAVFIAIVARNLFRSERFSNVDAVAQIAEAGIRYADKMLISSEEGADWRPKPENLGVSNTPIYPDVSPVQAAAGDLAAQMKNPDFKWLRAWWPVDLGFAGPTGGFTKFDTGGGRFLLRLTYEPNPKDPLSKYIKIESIGRWGLVDDEDPTTWARGANTGMRREITAYKPIGVTDYLRFVTNKDHRAIDFPLGCPGYQINFGRSTADTTNYGPRGAPIRVNGNLLWYGTGPSAIKLYLRGVPPLSGAAASADPEDLIPLDTVEVAGDIKFADPDMKVLLYRMNSSGVQVGVNPIDLPESSMPTFTTVNGFYRDAAGQAPEPTRRIKRLEPPLVDQNDTTDTSTRYRLLTLNSGERINRVNIGRYGWGRGVYIDNTDDTQDESETLFGGYSIRADWLKPNNPMSPFWKGPFYTPPGVFITLNPGDTDGDGQADMTITRSSGLWRDPDGRTRPDWGRTITMAYPHPMNGRLLKWRDATNNQPKERHIDGNGVIFAEGNIRIRGMLPPETQLTVVSNENIYIEGNILKFRNPNSQNPPSGPYLTTGEETESCGIALLARENVCVNTTQFFSPLNSINSDDLGSDADNGQPPFHMIVTSDPSSRPRLMWEFGPYESDRGSGAKDFLLMLRHSGQYGTSYINAWLNARNDINHWGILFLNENWPPGHTRVPTLPVHIWGIGDPGFNVPGWGIGSSFIGEAFPLTDTLNANLNTKPGMPNDIMIGLDQTTYTRNNYLLGGVAVQPMDVRIEAIIYAQEGSFFVLPGNWFNPNPSDIRPDDPFDDSDDNTRTGQGRPGGVRGRFPFFGDPLDIRIIVDGAISENMPATISDVSEWMSKWGKIPQNYGSASNAPTAHPGEGLTLLYDDHAGWPYTGLGGATQTPIRADKYGRTLPLAPKLPVSGSLIYFGDVM